MDEEIQCHKSFILLMFNKAKCKVLHPFQGYQQY